MWLCLLSAAVCPAAVTSTYQFPSGLAVPDNNITGLADNRLITDATGTIQHLTVSLAITGGWNGDWYAHLVHDTGFAVLLNRIGRTATDTVGSGTSGLNVVLDDRAAFDIHLGLPATGSLTGTRQPDARTADPDNVTESSPRRAFLDSFNGLTPNGQWTLFLADLSPGGTGTLASWSLEVTTIPEPGPALLLLAASILPMLRAGRQRTTTRPPATKGSSW